MNVDFFDRLFQGLYDGRMRCAYTHMLHAHFSVAQFV